jgi:hypothetical protein
MSCAIAFHSSSGFSSEEEMIRELLTTRVVRIAGQLLSGGGGSELNIQTAMYLITGGLSVGIIFASSI